MAGYLSLLKSKLGILWVSLNIVDLITTLIATSDGRFVELNPIISNLEWYHLIAYKTAGVLAVVGLSYLVGKLVSIQNIAKYFLIIACIPMGCVVISNIVLLIWA